MVIVKPYIEQGLVVLVTGGKHAAIVRPDGRKQPIPGSPSDHRALLNFKSQVRHFINMPVAVH